MCSTAAGSRSRCARPIRIPRDALRLPATLFDRRRTDWLAIWAFAIDHPDGLVVVDAGQDPNFKPSLTDVYARVAVRFDVGEEHRIENRLREAGLDPGNVSHQVFTHLHVDHVGTGPLPGAQVVVSSDEWRAATRFDGHLRGYRRGGFHEEPETVDGDHDLFGDSRIRIIATPGHTAGHQSVLVSPDDGPRVLITGDSVYSEEALVERRIDGVGVNAKKARASIDRMREICREAPTVVAPTHDVGAADRVANGQATTV